MLLAGFHDRLQGLKSFPRGIHPPHRKKLSEAEPIRLFIPRREMIVPLSQHIGPACKLVVKPNQDISYAEQIADTDWPVGAPIHASVNGKAGSKTMTLSPNGNRVPALTLEPAEHGEALPADSF